MDDISNIGGSKILGGEKLSMENYENNLNLWNSGYR